MGFALESPIAHSFASQRLISYFTRTFGYFPDNVSLPSPVTKGRIVQQLISRAKSVSSFPAHEGRRSKRVVTKKGASVVVNLGSHPQRVPCLIVDSSSRGFRLRGGFHLKRGQIVEVIPGNELNAIRCSVVWVGKTGSKQEGEVGVQTV